MDKREKKALNDIEEYESHVINVMEGDGEPSFTYSIGINKKQNKPDVVILGLKSELSHSMTNNYKDRLLSGETFEPGKYYADVIKIARTPINNLTGIKPRRNVCIKQDASLNQGTIMPKPRYTQISLEVTSYYH